MKEQINVELLDAHISGGFDPELDWFTISVSGIPRSVLQELSRHRNGISLSIESSRYTLKKHLKGKSFDLVNANPGDDIWGKYLWLTGDDEVDHIAHQSLALLVNQLERGLSNDKVKTLVPEGLLYKGTYTMTLEAWKHLYSLRSGKEVYEPFRLLVEEIKEALEGFQLVVTNNVYPIAHSQLYVCSHACRTCWDSHDKSDDGGKKDLELIERVGVKYRHQSVLEHLKFRTNKYHSLLYRELTRHRHYRKFIDEGYYYGHLSEANGDNFLLINMRTVVECMNDESFIHKTELYDIVPKEYRYLIDDIELGE